MNAPSSPDDPGREDLSAWRRLHRLVARYVTHSDQTRLKELMFRLYARRQSVSRVQTLVGAFGLLVFSFWPTDFLLFREPDVLRLFSLWRALTAGAVVGMFLLVRRVDITREGGVWLLVGVLSGYFALTGFLFGRIRGLSFPWFYIAYMIPMFSITLALDLLPRFLSGLAPTAAFVSAYMFNVPGSLQYPDLHQFLPLAGSSVFLFTMIGHSIFHLDRINFFQSRLVQKQKEKVKKLARRDQLTGLFNRREFENRFEDEFSRARRYEHDLSVLMLDLDHFKEINDTYGHQVGDRVLSTIGGLLNRTTRRVDLAGRYGGEEFTVVLPETPEESAHRSAERIHEELARRSFSTDGGEAFEVTCSIGVAAVQPGDRDPEDSLRRADRALYRAKERGRDCIVRAAEVTS